MKFLVLLDGHIYIIIMIYKEPELELYDQFPDYLLICILVHVD